MDLSVGSDHLWPWAPIPVAAGVAFLLTWWADRERRRPRGALLVAGSAAVRALPRFQRLARLRRRGGMLIALAALAVVAGAALVLARPQAVEVRPGEDRARDVMVCLDASFSMFEDNIEVIEQVRRVTDDLGGDRVGLMVWSGAAVVVVPLTDDAEYLRSGLDLVEEAFRTSEEFDALQGIDLPANRSSLIGDGLVSCVDHLPPDDDRIRAVLLTSDNEPFGKAVYPLPAAASYASRADVVVYGLGPQSLARPARAEARAELEDALTATGGTLALLGEDGTSEELVDRIDRLEESRQDTPDQEVTTDDPGLGVLLCFAGGLLLVLTWVWLAAGRVSSWRSS